MHPHSFEREYIHTQPPPEELVAASAGIKPAWAIIHRRQLGDAELAVLSFFAHYGEERTAIPLHSILISNPH